RKGSSVAYCVRGAIRYKYLSWRDPGGRGGPWSALGLPQSDELNAEEYKTSGARGRYTRFAGGSIYGCSK
ncbi:MAG: hypothetical protein NTU88_09905, partial [Armatimonadetes bacterium]|nr:hypothetical protein [Armatimonadota bacterium]